jgi:hypothetical protein
MVVGLVVETFVAQNCNHTQKKERLAGGSRRREPLVS